jgi:hypothetical protein
LSSAENVNLLENNIETIEENVETSIYAIKKLSPEVIADKLSIRILLSHHRHSRQNHNIKLSN